MECSRTLILILAFLASVTGWGMPPHASHLLRVRAMGEPQTLDWNRASTWIEGFIIRNTMQGLVGIDRDLNAVPELAQSWETSPDHKTYKFHIRSNLKWSDGKLLRAQDFVDSWKRLLAPATQAKYASILFDIEGAESFHNGKDNDFAHVGVKTLDDRTLQVTLNAPISYWYWIPSFYATYPWRADLDHDGLTAKVCLGPFRIAEYETGRRILLERNPYFSGSRGNLDQVDIALVHDDSTALKLYEVGQIDFLPKVPSLEQSRLKNRPDFRTWPDMRVVHLRMNTERNPLSNPHLRKAIAAAIDRSKLTHVFEGAYEPATAFVPKGILGYSRSAGVKFSLEKARAEMKASGLEPQRLPPLDLLTVAFDDQIILAQFIQEELQHNLGITVRIHILEPKRYYAAAMNHFEFAMQINFWGADFPDPDNFFSIFLSNSGLNRYQWKNEKYDRLVVSARSRTDRHEREKEYLAAQKILLEDEVETIPLYYGRVSGLIRKNVEGFKPGSMNWWIFKDLSVK